MIFVDHCDVAYDQVSRKKWVRAHIAARQQKQVLLS